MPNYLRKSTNFKIEAKKFSFLCTFKGIKKLFGPLLDDLDFVSAVKETMELQVEACT